MPQPEPELAVVRQILSYFVRNPRAVDSLEGVARWRLLEEQIHRSVQQTEGALTWLLSRGFLEEVRTAGSGRLFRLDSTRKADAVRFLVDEGAPKDESEC